jgi:hypothetical protein
MEAYKTILIKSNNFNNKSLYTQIKDQFDKSSDIVKKKQIKRTKTNINSEKRPKLIKNRNQKIQNQHQLFIFSLQTNSKYKGKD